MNESLIFENVTFSSVGNSLDDAKLKEFESRLKIGLPGEYRRFLLAANGGVPNPSSFGIEDKPEEDDDLVLKPIGISQSRWETFREIEKNVIFPLRVDRFESLQDLESSKINLTTKDDASSLLTIGFDNSNGPIYLSVSKSNFGFIYEQDSELDYEPEISSPISLLEFDELILAKSFSEFLQGLRIAKIVSRDGFKLEQRHHSIMDFSVYEDPI